MRTDSPQQLRVPGGGLQLGALRWPGDGPALVLIHGYLDCAGSFAPLVRRLPAHWDIVALDMRGHGRSDFAAPSSWYHFDDYVRDVRAALDWLDLDQPVLLGHSMGGAIVLQVAGAWHDLCGVVLVEGLGPPGEELSDGPTRMARWCRELVQREGLAPRSMATLADAAKRLQKGNHRLGDELARELAGWLALEQDDGTWRWRHDPRHRVRSPRLFQPERYQHFGAAIRCPVTLVSGGESGFAGAWQAARHSWFADPVHHELAGAGHMVHHDAPEALAAVLTAVVGSGRPAG